MSDVTSLLEKNEQDLQQYVSSSPNDHLQNLFTEMWGAIRQVQMFGGTARTAASSEALTLAQLALQVATFSNIDSLRAEAHRMMAYVLTANEQYEDSLSHYGEAIALWKKEGSFPKVARAQLGSISALFMTGRYEQAVEEAQRADEWFLKNNDEDGHARLSVNLGNLYHRLDQHSRAVQHHNTAIKAFRRLKNTAALAPCFLNLGDSLSMLDRFDEADRNFEKCQKLSLQLGQTSLFTQAKYNRAYLSFLRGRYSNAIQGFSELRAHYTENGSLRHAALCDLDESEIYLQLNLTGDALKLAERAAESFKQLGMKYEEAKARAFVGIGLMHRQQAADALQIFHESQLIFEEQNNLYWGSSLELYRAQGHFQLGRFWEARTLAQEAHDRFLSLNIPSKRAMSLALLTRIALEVGETDEAIKHSQSIEELLLETPIPLHLFPCYSIMAQVAEYRNDLEKAEELYTLAAREIEIHRTNLHHDELRVTFFKGKQQVYEALIRLALRHRGSKDRVVEAYAWC